MSSTSSKEGPSQVVAQCQPDGGVTPELLASARLFIRRHGVKLIVVDYLRLVDAPGRDLRERVGNVADALRQLAKTERIGVVLLSQLRRPEGGINARPTMLDLKESGDIEAHSHVVLLPYLPVADDGKPIPEEQLLIIGKNRNGGVGSLPVYFDENRLQFMERERSRNGSDRTPVSCSFDATQISEKAGSKYI